MNESSRVSAIVLCGMLASGFVGAQASSPVETPPPSDCKPQYPKAAQHAGAEGVSVVAFHLDEAGTVTRADVVRSAGHSREHRLLDQATVRALSACKFTPLKDADGHPVAGAVTVSYRWALE